MRYLSIAEILDLHRRLIEESGGSAGLRDRGGLQSAVAQPRVTFGGEELYPSVIEKAAALAVSLIRNHPFIDGNKRVAHAAMAVFLLLNGRRIEASVDEQERLIVGLAAGDHDREDLSEWLSAHVVEKRSGA
jgi:death-on-curing protein